MLQAPNGIRISRGEDQTLDFTVTSPDSELEDLTDARIVMTIKEDPDDSNPVLIKTSDNILQVQIIKPLAGYVRIYLTASDTRLMDPGKYFYDVWVTLSSGKSYPIIATSVIEITKSVTRF